MKNETKHTPGELKRYKTSVQFICIDDKTIGYIGGTQNPEENEANADRFILTWNCHNNLLTVCKASVEHIRDFLQSTNDPEDLKMAVIALEQVINKVETLTQ